jgi:DNA-binding response OmpR family regulator
VSGPERPRRILVVDDEEDVQILVSRILRDMGFECEGAGEGSRAIAQIEAQRPDLVVLDLMMPGVDGWGVLEFLHSQPDPPPVVLLSARSDFATLSRGIREGAAAYVFKPFRFHELVATCQRVLLEGARRTGPALAVEERRQHPRRVAVVNVKVLSRERSPITLGELVNISLGGAEVQLGLALAQGDLVRLAFHIPGGGSGLTMLCEVRWRLPAAGHGFAHGLRFTELGPDEERQLRELLRPPS